ncbi:MAG: (Fe-S)-binding protein [Promethearchaeota archaeon]
MELKQVNEYKEFKDKDCIRCGECFHKCPVLKLPLDIAKKEIESILENNTSKIVLKKCVGCMSCNQYCPNDCNPYSLIINKWHDKYREKGLPGRAKLVLTLPFKNPYIHSFIIPKLPKEERAIIKLWEDKVQNPDKKETMMFASCNLMIQPYMYDSKLYKDMTIFGSTKLCCGEPLYRAGLFEGHELVAQNNKKELEKIGFKKLIVPCVACYHMFKYVYDANYGIKMNFEVISIIDWLYKELTSGKYELVPLNFSVCVHDNCWPKMRGNDIFNRVRELLKLCGVKIIELEHSKEDALCCGLSAACSTYSIFPLLHHAKIRLKQFKKSGADVVVDYCGGCNWIFLVANSFSIKKKTPQPILTLMEIIQLAIGEQPSKQSKKRGGMIIKSLLGKVIKSYLTLGHYYVEEL